MEPLVFDSSWSRRLVDALRREGIATWEDLATLSAVTLLEHKYIGHKTLAALRDGLARRGMAFAAASGRRAVTDVIQPAPIIGVYFIRCGAFIKIGRSKNVRQRAWNIGLAVPLDIQLLHVVCCETWSGAADCERYFHRRFAAARHRGEWFHETGELAEFLADTHP